MTAFLSVAILQKNHLGEDVFFQAFQIFSDIQKTIGQHHGSNQAGLAELQNAVRRSVLDQYGIDLRNLRLTDNGFVSG